MAEAVSEIVRLFLDAPRILASTKCRVTAKATFNRAMALLEGLERSYDPEVASEAKQLHARARQMIGRDTSLPRILEVYASLMAG